jgi:DNA-binding transcriptional ArsR family regulator
MTEQTKEHVLDRRLVKAMGHPLRHRILVALNLRVASPSELAEELGEPLGNVAYHTKILAENDAIEQVRTAPVRGALEHFYRATIRPWFDDEEWAQLPASLRRELQEPVVQDIWRDLVRSGKAGGFEDPKTHFSRTYLDLDEEAYEEIVDLLNSVVDRALELHAEAAPRLAGLPAEDRDTHRTTLALMHFHRPPAEITDDRQSVGSAEDGNRTD